MKSDSRVGYTVKNAGVGAITQILSLVLSFVTRTYFIKTLGNDYLSINGLFTNILTVLNFAELGIGASITYSLYEPIAKHNHQKIGQLMHLLRNAYNYIALTITILGICLIPFLKYLITDIEDINDITFIYILILANTVFSYVWGYKRSLLSADQKNYVVLTIHMIIECFKAFTQILILVYTHNYLLFLGISIIFTIASNLVSTAYVNRHYQEMRNYEHEVLEKIEKSKIFDNIKSIVLYKLGSVLLGGTNSIVISVVLRTTLVGIVSNYLLIVNAVAALVNQSISGIAASIGNYNVHATADDNFRIYRQLNFLSTWFFGLLSVGIAICLNPFIYVWLGQDYILSNESVISIVSGFYVLSTNSIPSSYRTAMGLFKQTRYFPMTAAIVNLCLSVWFAKIYGIAGVFWATTISRLIFFNFVDSFFVLKLGMGKKLSTYYIQTITGLICCIISYVISLCIINNIHADSILNLILSIGITVLVYNITFLIININNQIGLQAIKRLIRLQ